MITYTVTVKNLSGAVLAKEEIEAGYAWEAVILADRIGLLPSEPFLLQVEEPVTAWQGSRSSGPAAGSDGAAHPARAFP